MTKPQSAHDEFEGGFKADDEFEYAPAERWPPSDDQLKADALAVAAPAVPHEEIEHDDLDALDFPPAALSAPAPAPNPVGELIAGAESALGEAVAPRISIHIFCVRPETAAAAETASKDRRMSRATATVQPGGLDEAI